MVKISEGLTVPLFHVRFPIEDFYVYLNWVLFSWKVDIYIQICIIQRDCRGLGALGLCLGFTDFSKGALAALVSWEDMRMLY